jgi:hypothetical protein
MITKIQKTFTVLTLTATVVGMLSSGVWFVSSLTDVKTPFGKYTLSVEPGTEVARGAEYWAKWNIERLRNDCRIGYVTVLFDAEGKEHVLASSPLGPPAKADVHPGEVRSYSRKYKVPSDAALGVASMTSRIQWVCNDVRKAFGLINYGHYNIETFVVVPAK